MGGCYSGSYGYSSPCSVPATPAWQRALKAALKNGDRSKLSEAYQKYFSERSSGFIAEAAKAIGIDSVESIPKEFAETEYEVKFAMQAEGKGNEPSIESYLNAFDFPATRHARFLKDPVHSIATGINRFYGTENDERLVVITKGKGTFLKEKGSVQNVDVEVPYKDLVIKRSEVRYPAEIDDVMNKITSTTAEEGVAYRGRIRKEKGDDFILDANDGRIYSFTVTRAHLVLPGSEEEVGIQRQLEIEYAGYLPGFDGFERESETQIVAGMVDLGRYTFGLYGNAPLGRGWRMQLSPTDERKYDFIVRGGRQLAKNQKLALPSEILASRN